MNWTLPAWVVVYPSLKTHGNGLWLARLIGKIFFKLEKILYANLIDIIGKCVLSQFPDSNFSLQQSCSASWTRHERKLETSYCKRVSHHKSKLPQGYCVKPEYSDSNLRHPTSSPDALATQPAEL
ncbi:hypothetical protein AVEN_44539-1 [Araneus ventricosus]|uniref:Uncharacterized protein n=1 Tax=Araneus ventricosus TaxID=182803 RepID=A0A4Y2F7X1_ARAVE|nr:hypothetical protein AVEN_44539-1 [Araneus ventricosus]